MRVILIFLSLCLLSTETFSQDKKAIFLVHSTGTDLYSQGKVSDWLKNYNSVNGTNFQITTRIYPENPWSWSNYPHDYWKLWIDKSCNNADPDIECLESLASKYDMVIFKHCYPGAGIEIDLGKPDVTSNRKSLENYKLQYRALRSLMDGMPNKKFMVWTLVPLHRLATSPIVATRANEFVKWVKNQWLTEDGKLHPNIYIFDFFSLVAETKENPTNGIQYCLKYEYEYSHTSTDSHPNVLANQTVGPIFAQEVVKILSSNLYITKITVSSSNETNTINTDKGTLQLLAAVLPTDAITKTTTWSVVNLTGVASISPTGLLKAEKDGIVKVVATSNDGRGIKGELLITISNQVIPVQSITLSSSSTYINTNNGTLQLQAIVLPTDASNKEVTWSLVNMTGKASISSYGTIIAENNGTVKAVATANDSSGTKCELLITITNQKILVQSITIIDNLKNDTISGIGKKILLKANVVPEAATNKNVEWNIDNMTGMASITNDGLLTTYSPGLIKVKAKATDGSNVYSQKEYLIIIPTDTKNLDTPYNFRVYLNPTNKKIQIHLNKVPSEAVILEIQNIIGRKIFEQKIYTSDSEWTFNKSAGNIYLITLRGKNFVSTQKIIFL